MEIVPLDASYVKGSHGIPNEKVEDGPMLISSRPDLLPEETLPATDVFDVMLRHLTET